MKNSIRRNRVSIFSFSCALVIVLLSAGCDFFAYNDPFPDSYYTTNFIGTTGFDRFSGDQPSIPPADPDTGETVYVTGSWDCGYRYVDWDGFDYIRFERASPTAVASNYSSVPEGLQPTAPVYRLELVNLIEGGHFESGATGSWSVTGTGTGSATHNALPRISGTGSMLLAADSGQLITFEPDVASGFSTRAALAYSVFYRFSSNDPFLARVGTDSLDLDSDSGTSTGLFSPASDSAPVVFRYEPESVGTSFSALYVDDFSMAKSGGMALRLQLRPSETLPLLEPGTYEFSVWVCPDPSTDPAGNSGPYPLKSLGVSMKALGNAELAVKSARYTPTGGWTRVSAILSGQALQYPRDDAITDEPVLELVIDFENANPGSILLAAPELRFK